MCSMAKPIEGEVRRALEEGTYPRAFEAAAVVLDGLTLREGLELTLGELDGGDPVLYDAPAARGIAIAQLQGRASLNGVWWLAGRFEEILNPVRRETAELYKVVERNPQSRFRARRPDHLPAVDRDVLRRRTAADLAMLDAALARGDADAAWEWMTPSTPIDRLARLVGLLARRGDERRLDAASRRLIVRFTAEAGRSRAGSRTWRPSSTALPAPPRNAPDRREPISRIGGSSSSRAVQGSPRHIRPKNTATLEVSRTAPAYAALGLRRVPERHREDSPPAYSRQRAPISALATPPASVAIRPVTPWLSPFR